MSGALKLPDPDFGRLKISLQDGRAGRVHEFTRAAQVRLDGEQ
jgi:hypothetical protein